MSFPGNMRRIYINMKKFLHISLLSVIFFTSTLDIVYAEDSVNINLKIYAGDTVLFNGSEAVTACVESPAVDAPITVNGKCAVEQSLLSNTWTWNYAPSGWLDEVGGYSTTPDFSKFWSWFSNLSLGSTGLNQHILSAGEELLLTYNAYPLRIRASTNSGTIGDTIIFTVEEESTFDANYQMLWTLSEGATVTLGNQSCTTIADGTCSIVLDTAGLFSAIGSKSLYVPSANLSIEVSNSPVQSSVGGGGSYYTPPPVEKIKFDNKKAFEFLIAQQKENGSFGEDIYTDWVAIALTGGNYQDKVLKLVKYFGESKMAGILLTDYERRAMALMSLGLNPYNTNGINYIEKIINSFDGKQFGDVHEDNDDIFALIVLQNAGFTQGDEMIKNDIDLILSAQNQNGSWDDSIDMTGAAIEALASFNQNDQVRDALIKAENFLKQNQKDDGGWGNVSSTAWAIEGILALNKKPEDWIKSEKTPLDYLAFYQDTDGGIKNENIKNKIWETSYALSVLSGKSWNQMMQKFTKPQEIVSIEILKEIIQETEINAVAIKDKMNASVNNVKNTKIKLENLASQNTVTVIDAVTNLLPAIQAETQKKNWFMKFLDSILRF